MINIDNYIIGFSLVFGDEKNMQPWEITEQLSKIIEKKLATLNNTYTIRDGVAIHQTAVVEDRAILKAPAIIEEHCFVGHNAYIRGGVYLGKNSSVGPGCEVKTSIIFGHTEIAHLNFIGDSIIGSDINLEAGSITANYFNEREDKIIMVRYGDRLVKTNVNKFGSLIGDRCKVGANAVLSPGTILLPGTVVQRLELVKQYDIQ